YHSLSFNSTSGPFAYRGRYHAEPIGAGTRFTQVLEWEPSGWLKMVEPVLALTFKRSGDHYMLYESNLLKNVLERHERCPFVAHAREVKP
ncbi:MAG: hypothetical protein LC737_00455, partial [Chloroflexi bacterium]|nr:hypothetical protein [Chloroflexota bacterium]